MTAQRVRQLAEVLCVLAVAGCHRPAAMQVDPPTPVRPLVFYDDTGSPSEYAPTLSDLELDRIVDSMAQMDESIWFIRVKPSIDKRERGLIIVYLAPEQQTPRVREGLAYHIWMLGQEMSITSPWRYIQISAPDRMFGNRLDLPSACDLPFALPRVIDRTSGVDSPLAMDEIVRIVDFLRQPASYEEPATHRTVPDQAERQRPYELPILRMSRNADTIRVEFGFLHDGLFGYGQHVTLERTPGGYKITKWGMWIS